MKKKDGQNVVQLRVRVGSLSYIAAEQVVNGEELLLKITGTPLEYAFHVGNSKDNTYTELGKLDTRYLSTEVAGGFTGVMIGLYASSNGKPGNAKAYYDWFEYSSKK
jgi:alpha-N-arabinofuranosidase